MCVNPNPKCGRCVDCGKPHPPKDYAVWQDSLWEKFGIGPSYRQDTIVGYTRTYKWDYYNNCKTCHVLCFFCFEERMGRMATINDLMPGVFCNIQWATMIRERDKFIHENFDVLPDGELKFRG